MLKYDQNDRITPREAMQHEYFTEIRELHGTHHKEIWRFKIYFLNIRYNCALILWKDKLSLNWSPGLGPPKRGTTLANSPSLLYALTLFLLDPWLRIPTGDLRHQPHKIKQGNAELQEIPTLALRRQRCSEIQSLLPRKNLSPLKILLHSTYNVLPPRDKQNSTLKLCVKMCSKCSKERAIAAYSSVLRTQVRPIHCLGLEGKRGFSS